MAAPHGNLGKKHKPEHPVFKYFSKHPELDDTVICMVKVSRNRNVFDAESSDDDNDISNPATMSTCGKTFKIHSAGQKNAGTMTSNLLRHLGRLHHNEEEIVKQKVQELAASAPPAKSRKV